LRRTAAAAAAAVADDDDLGATTSSQTPTQRKYVLVGSGPAAFAAYTAIRESDPTGSVLIVSGNAHTRANQCRC
jgi:hypothetical protein